MSRRSHNAAWRASSQGEICVEISSDRSSGNINDNQIDLSSSSASTASVSPASHKFSKPLAVAKNVLRMVDLHTLLSKSNDAEFLAQLRHEPLTAQLERATAEVVELKSALMNSSVSNVQKAALLERVDVLSVALKTLQADTTSMPSLATGSEDLLALVCADTGALKELILTLELPEDLKAVTTGRLDQVHTNLEAMKVQGLQTRQATQDQAGSVGESIATEGARLARLSANVTALQSTLGASELPAELKQVLSKRLHQVITALAELQNDKPLANRVAKVIAINALLAPLPLMIPMMSKPVQPKTEAEIIALMAKAMIEGIGLIRTPTTGNSLLKDRTMARYYANTIQALEFSLPTFVSSLHFLNKSTPFNIGLGLLSTAGLFGGFMSKEIKEKFNQWRSGNPHPKLADEGKRLFGDMQGLGEEPQALHGRMKVVLQQLMEGVTHDKQSLLETKEAFVGSNGHELSPYVSKQVAMAVGAYQQVADELSSLMGNYAPAGGRHNKDRSAKLALALFATAVCAATTVLMLPDKIGVVDLGSDAAFTSALMFSLMANSNVSRKDALEEFKTFVGLSLVMLALLATNKGTKDFMEKGSSGLLIGSITMTALNLTLPGPIGHYAASGIEKLMNLKPSDLLAAVHGVGQWVCEMFCGSSTEPKQKSNVVIQEIVEPDLEHGLGA
ncbi:hypothetical protein [Uliginosibacterium gangwonense]|uniref:hypothetical protein n=1 Tax=Uliginosibacterium gangwonense TaxID=392736 RepID=UPI000368EA4B|nr:hypothetical protein [Uliginosibacterium gangwonense]